MISSKFARNRVIALRSRLFDAVTLQSSSETIGHWASCQRRIDDILALLEEYSLDCNREWQNALSDLTAENALIDNISYFG